MANWFEAVSGEKNERISAILSAIPGAAEKVISAAVRRGETTARSTALAPAFVTVKLVYSLSTQVLRFLAGLKIIAKIRRSR